MIYVDVETERRIRKENKHIPSERVTSNFSFSHSVLYLLEELSAIFIKNSSEIVVCKFFPFWKRLKFVVLERVNEMVLAKFKRNRSTSACAVHAD